LVILLLIYAPEIVALVFFEKKYLILSILTDNMNI